ncbi:MAG: acetate kinase [Candidatus Coatesbacteria bacterium]|nr:MAG: acetate kinase [Candidatus Coatesbacteria bacterium]
MKILTLNCGSSSVKYILYDWEGQETLARGLVERVTIPGSRVVHEVPGRDEYILERDCPDHEAAINLVLELFVDPGHGVVESPAEIAAVGHRTVHGGEKFARSVIIDDNVVKTLRDLIQLAPLHNPANIAGINAARALLPDVPHVAVFDTAFHQTMPDYAYLYALPYEWYSDFRIRRYGFHGTSHLYVSRRAAVMLGKKPSEVNVITCHIGNGASVAAVEGGRSVDTSMGLTPLEGVVMGTRSGDIDPAIPAFCQQTLGMDVELVYKVLNRDSGVKGLSGKYVDRRDIEACMGDYKEPMEADAMPGSKYRCKMAFLVEAYHLAKYVGAYAAVLTRVDALVFTAGVGENAPLLREAVCARLGFMGVKIDLDKNNGLARGAAGDISTENSNVRTFVIPTDEERVFVEDVAAILNGTYDTPDKFEYTFQREGYREA